MAKNKTVATVKNEISSKEDAVKTLVTNLVAALETFSVKEFVENEAHLGILYGACKDYLRSVEAKNEQPKKKK